MPDKTGRMTPKEIAFVRSMAAPPSPTEAARRAGYPHPSQAGHRNMQSPAINHAIALEQTAVLFNEILPLAVSTLRDLLQSPATPAGARVQAVKLALDRTLGAGDDAAARKELHEMTIEELEKRRQELLRERSDAAKVIEPEPGDTAQNAPTHPVEPSVFG